MKSSDPIQRLSEIKTQIAALKQEAHGVIDSLKADFESGSGSPAAAASPAPRRGRKPASAPSAEVLPAAGRKSSMKGRKRSASPSGPLPPAVVAVLRAAGRPMKVAEIYEALLAAKYVFTAGDAKKNLGVRMYKLPGVKQLGSGLFGLEAAAPVPAPTDGALPVAAPSH